MSHLTKGPLLEDRAGQNIPKSEVFQSSNGDVHGQEETLKLNVEAARQELEHVGKKAADVSRSLGKMESSEDNSPGSPSDSKSSSLPQSKHSSPAYSDEKPGEVQKEQ